MKLFRGYIEVGDDKRPLEPYVNKSSSELRTYEEVKGMKGYAGVLNYDVTLVDIDDPKDAERLLNLVKGENIGTVVYQTTKGMHFYFKADIKVSNANSTGKMTPIGLRVDYKHGHKNGIGNLKLTTEPHERKILYQSDKLDKCPVWLTDIGKGVRSIAEIDEGERNDSLFSYILTLQRFNLTKSEIRETLRLVNKYIIDNPITDEELDVILRDDSFTEELFFGGRNGTTFLFDKFAEYLVKEHNIIKLNNRLHVYKDGVYIPGDKAIEKAMIHHLTLTQTQRNEVLAYIDLIAPDDVEPSDARYIAFKNGVYDTRTKELLDFSDRFVLTNKIPHDYNPDAYCELVDQTLCNLAVGDKKVKMLLEEMIGYTFYRRNERRKFFILVGDRGNGKSTLIGMIQYLLGRDNTSSLDLNELDDRFRAVKMFGKLANLGDDISGEYIRDPSQLKRVSAGNSITVEKKGEDAFDFNPYCKLIFAANNIPRIKDPTGAAQDRMIIIPLRARFTKDSPDYNPDLKYDLQEPEAMEYLIQLGLEGLDRVLYEGGFTQSEMVEKELKDYEIFNNPVKAFFNQYKLEEILDKPVNDLYNEYKTFCFENNLKSLGRIVFGREVSAHFGTTTKQVRINGKRTQVIVKEE